MAAIIPFLNDASFDQKGIEAMSIALEEVCRTLDISKDNKAAAEVVAIRIIELARQGERSPIKLSDRVLSEANGASGVGHERHPKSAHNLAVADAAQSMTLDQVDITRQLAERQPRVPDYASQKRATADLMRVARESPTELLGRFVELARELCGAASAGISLYEPDPASAGVFRWHHLSGVLAPFTGATTPRDHSPCGVCLDRRGPILMRHPELTYEWIREASITVPEVLLIPLQVGKEEQIGTLWVVAAEGTTFDAEHSRILNELAGVASIASELARLNTGIGKR